MTGGSGLRSPPRAPAHAPSDPETPDVRALAAMPWAAVLILALVGGAASWLLSRPAPAAPGAARITSAVALLAMFDMLWLLSLSWPRSCGARVRLAAAALLLTVGLPFHAALAAAAGASGGHAAACAAIAVAAALASALAGARRLFAPLLAVALFALPLAAYALTDLGRVGEAASWGRASPLLAAALLAMRASEAVLADGVPAVVALLAVATLALVVRRPPRAAIALLLLTGGLGSAAMAAPSQVEPVLGGHVREGRPLVVRAPGARRVRIEGGPWAGPVGTRGDEFVLLGVGAGGATLALDVDRSGGARASGTPERVEVTVRPLPLAGEWTAALDGRDSTAGVVAVKPVDLPTVAEAWLLFDAVVGVPDGLAAAERLALEARLRGMHSVVPEPALLRPSPLPFRAAAEAAAAAPGLPAGAARILIVLAALVVLLAIVMRLRPSDRQTAVWAGGVSLVAACWLLVGDMLPGAVHANAIVLAGESAELVLLRLAANRDSEVTVEAPPGASVLVPLRWGTDDAPPDGQAVGARATLRIARGRSVLLAVRVPRSPSSPSAAGDAMARGRPLADWVRGLGARLAERNSGGTPPDLRLDGARLVRVDRYDLLRSE